MNKKIRNPAARSAIMGKGGVHEKTHKAKRKKEKQLLKKKLRAGSFGSFFNRTDKISISNILKLFSLF